MNLIREAFHGGCSYRYDEIGCAVVIGYYDAPSFERDCKEWELAVRYRESVWFAQLDDALEAMEEFL